MNEIDKFFSDLPSEDKKVADVFSDKPQEPVVPEKDKNDAVVDDSDKPRKNREFRRLEAKYEQERISAIQLAEKVKLLEEDRLRDKNTQPNNLDSDLLRVFGDTDAGKEVARIFDKKLSDVQAQAKEQALKEFEERQGRAVQEQKQHESFIDSQLETLEDTYNVDLTSDAPAARKARREFLEMVQSLSPKDQNGNLVDYADFDATFGVYQKSHTTDKSSDTVNRQKEIASRSMQKSVNQGANQPAQATPGFRGWMKDYGVNQ